MSETGHGIYCPQCGFHCATDPSMAGRIGVCICCLSAVRMPFKETDLWGEKVSDLMIPAHELPNVDRARQAIRRARRAMH